MAYIIYVTLYIIWGRVNRVSLCSVSFSLAGVDKEVLKEGWPRQGSDAEMRF